MTGISEDSRRVKPDPLKPTIVNGDFELDVNKDNRTDHWHYQRQTELVEAEDAPTGSRYLTLSNNDPGRLSQLVQGFPIQGGKIGFLKFQFWVKYDKVVFGEKKFEKPLVTISYYTSKRRLLGQTIIGPWQGTMGWQPVTKTIIILKQHAKRSFKLV